MVISENNHCVHKPDPGVKKVALGCQRCPTFHRSCFIGHCTLSAPFTTYLLSLNVNATPPLLVDTNNKGHSVALCPSHCCVIWPAGGSTQPRSDVQTSSCQPPSGGGAEGNLIWLGEKSSCLLEQIQSRSLLQGETGVTPCGAGGRRLDSTGDTILVTISSQHYTLVATTY